MPSPRFHPAVRLAICVAGIVFLSLVVAVVIDAALTATAAITGRAVTLEAFSKRNPLLITLLFYPPALLWLWFCRHALDRRSFVSLGLRLAGAGRGFFTGALAGALAMSLLFSVLWLTGHVAVNGPSPEAFEAGPLASAAILAFFALAFFAVGFMEEISFRGYALHNLTAWMGGAAAIAMQAVLFALVHLSNVLLQPIPAAGGAADVGAPNVAAAPGLGDVLWDTRFAMLNIALIGVFFALCYLKTGSLWFPIGFHAAWNFCLGCIFSLPVSGIKVFRVLDVTVSPNALVTGGAFGAEGSVLLSVLLGAMLWVVWQQPGHARAALDLGSLRAAPQQPEPLSAPSVPPIPPPGQAPEQEPEPEYAPPRFQTTMRPAARTPQLDLSGLNTLSSRTASQDTASQDMAQAAAPAASAHDAASGAVLATALLEGRAEDELRAEAAANVPVAAIETPVLSGASLPRATRTADGASASNEAGAAARPMERPAASPAAPVAVPPADKPLADKPAAKKPAPKW